MLRSFSSIWDNKKTATERLQLIYQCKQTSGFWCGEKLYTSAQVLNNTVYAVSAKTFRRDNDARLSLYGKTISSTECRVLKLWTSEVRFAEELKVIYLVTASTPILGPTQPPDTMSTGNSFPGVKRPERETHHSPPSGADVKNVWSYTSTSPYVFMV